MKVTVSVLSQVILVDGKHVCEEVAASGKITVPKHAQCVWNITTGPSWTWNEEQHLRDDGCQECKAGLPCTQNVTVWPRSETVLVVHNYHPPVLN